MRFAYFSAMTFITRVIVLCCSVLSQLILARYLGPEGKGAYSVVVLVPSMLFLMGNFGLHVASVYYIGKNYDRRKIADNALSTALLLSGFFVIFSVAVLHIWSPGFLKGIPFRQVVIAVLTLPGIMVYYYFSNFLLGMKEITRYNKLEILQAGMIFAGTCIAILMKGGVFAVIFAWVLAMTVSGIAALATVRRLVGISLNFHREIFSEMFEYGLKGYVANLLQFFNYRLDVFILSYFSGLTEVGYYSLAVNFGEMVWYIGKSTATVLFPVTSSRTPEEANEFTPKVCRNIFVLSLASGLVLALIARPLVMLTVGHAFLPSLAPLWLILPGIILFSFSVVLSSDFAGRGKIAINTAIAAGVLLITVILDLILIPGYRSCGAAIASTAAYTAAGIASVIIFSRITGVKMLKLAVPVSSDLQAYRSLWNRITGRQI